MYVMYYSYSKTIITFFYKNCIPLKYSSYKLYEAVGILYYKSNEKLKMYVGNYHYFFQLLNVKKNTSSTFKVKTFGIY